MPFKKGDAATIAAAKKGGRTGKKYLETAPKKELREIRAKGGQARWAAEKAKKRSAQDRRAEKYVDKVMSKFLN